MKKIFAFILVALAFAGVADARLLSLKGNRLTEAALPPDTLPDAFSFGPLTGQLRSTSVTNVAIIPVGYNATATATVSGSGCTISVAGGGGTTSTNISPTNDLRVINTTSASYSTETTCTVTLGGSVQATASFTTEADPGSCTTAAQQMVAFFNLGSCDLQTTTEEAAMAAPFAGRNTLRNTYASLNNYNACNSPTPTYHYNIGPVPSTFALYGDPFEAFINQIRGGTDNRTAADCFMHYWVANLLQGNSWFMNEPKSDMWSFFAMCKLGRGTTTGPPSGGVSYTPTQWCNTIAAGVFDQMWQWYSGSGGTIFQTTATDAAGRIWSRVWDAMMFASHLGLPSARGLNQTVRAQEIATQMIANQHADGYFFTSNRNGAMQMFQQAMIVQSGQLHYDNFNAAAGMLTMIEKWAEWSWAVGLRECHGSATAKMAPTNGNESASTCYFHYVLPKYASSEGAWEGENGGTGALNAFFERAYGWLYRRTGNVSWRDRMMILMTSRYNGPPWDGGAEPWFDGGMSNGNKEKCESFCLDPRNSTDYAATGLPSYTKAVNTTRAVITGTVAVGQVITMGSDVWANCTVNARQYRWVHRVPGTNASTSGQTILAGETSASMTIPSGSGRAYIGNVRASCDGGSTWSLWEPTRRTAPTA